MKRLMIVGACALGLVACGGGSDAPSSSKAKADAPAQMSLAEFVEACAAYHTSDLASHPENVTAEAYCGCIASEMDATMAGIMNSLETMSGESIPDDFETTQVSSTVAKQAENYRTSIRLNKVAQYGDDDFDTLANATEGVAGTECYMRMADF